MVVALDPGDVRAELQLLAGEGDALVDRPGVEGFVASLAQADWAWVMFLSLEDCDTLQNVVLGKDLSNLDELRAKEAPFVGHPYDMLVLAERFEARPAIGQIAFLYGNVGYAKADLELRSRADEIPSLQVNQAYRDFSFRTTDVAADGGGIVLDVVAIPNGELDLAQLLGTLDMMFALCGRVPGTGE
jgi:hypothetical protein